MGLPKPTCSIDLWAVGVCLFELYTGKVMYAGRSNNEMLRLMLKSKGRLPNKVVRQHINAYSKQNLEPHFDKDTTLLKFKYYEVSRSGQRVMKTEDIPHLPLEENNIGSMLRGRSSSSGSAADSTLVNRLENFLNRCLSLDRTKRCSVDEALGHTFFARWGEERETCKLLWGNWKFILYIDTKDICSQAHN